jgi:2-methylisocitrate lyase-like PEP mutase family enzyme
MMSAAEKRKRLRTRLAQPQALIAPGIYDGYGARLVQNAGFEAAYMTGNGVSACLFGMPDVGLVDLTMIAAHAQRVAACIDIPLICDADTGYGGVVNIRRTVREFEAAGVAAIHIEDQVSPKRCSQLPGARAVLDLPEAAGKIEAAVAARCDRDFMIIARTDCAEGLGMDEAVRRIHAFVEAGADAVFVELKASPALLDNIRRVADAVAVPCVFNIDSGGALAEMHAGRLHELGIRLAIYPGLARGAAGFAIANALEALQRDGNTAGVRAQMFSSKEYNAALGLQEVEEWEARFHR